MLNLWYDLLHLLYPNLCAACGQAMVHGEEGLCLHCLHKLPRTRFATQTDNRAEQLFWGKVPMAHGTAWCYFQKGGDIQQLLHRLKYRHARDLGRYMGRQFGYELQDSPLADCDVLLPVPLHPRKLRLRGYNQSEEIAKGLSDVLRIPIDTQALYRTRANQTQTHKGVYARWENSQGLFALRSVERLYGHKVMLVDDVITTGATLEACARCLQEVPDVEINFAALAIV